jgi:hypothetical protein
MLLSAQASTQRKRQRVKDELTTTATKLNARHTRIPSGRPQTNNHVQAPHKTILDECWRPAFARLYPSLSGLRRKPSTYLKVYTFDHTHHAAAPAAASPQTSSTAPARRRPDEPDLSAHLGVRPP